MGSTHFCSNSARHVSHDRCHIRMQRHNHLNLPTWGNGWPQSRQRASATGHLPHLEGSVCRRAVSQKELTMAAISDMSLCCLLTRFHPRRRKSAPDRRLSSARREFSGPGRLLQRRSHRRLSSGADPTGPTPEEHDPGLGVNGRSQSMSYPSAPETLRPPGSRRQGGLFVSGVERRRHPGAGCFASIASERGCPWANSQRGT